MIGKARVGPEPEHANALLRRPAVALRLRPQGYKTWRFESEGGHEPFPNGASCCQRG
jgi:hypothetical protein